MPKGVLLCNAQALRTVLCNAQALHGPRRGSLAPAAGPLSNTLCAMAATPDDLFALLDRLRIAHATVNHAPLFTVEQSRALRGSIPGGHTKNLFLRDKKGVLVLLTALEDAAIDLKGLHRQLGAGGRFSFGSAELLRQALGIEPGAVTPFAAMNDREGRVSIVLDAALLRHQTINCHPLRNTMTTSIAPRDLIAFLEATGHPPRVVELAAAPAEAAGLIANTPADPI
jgi:Ala-tRNA(Pro) deacylase